jgi:hypothetical protein
MSPPSDVRSVLITKRRGRPPPRPISLVISDFLLDERSDVGLLKCDGVVIHESDVLFEQASGIEFDDIAKCVDAISLNSFSPEQPDLQMNAIWALIDFAWPIFIKTKIAIAPPFTGYLLNPVQCS